MKYKQSYQNSFACIIGTNTLFSSVVQEELAWITHGCLKGKTEQGFIYQPDFYLCQM